jgi:hypothetical protein
LQIGVCLAAAMLFSSCATESLRPAPAPLVPGASLAEVAAAHEAEIGPPILALLDGAQAIAVYGADAKGRVIEWSAIMPPMLRALVFDNGGYLGTLDSAQALEHRGCLLPATGPRLLAARLRALAAGDPDPVSAANTANRVDISAGAFDCPWPAAASTQEASANAAGPGEAAAGLTAATAGFALAPFIAVGGAAYAAAGAAGLTDRGVIERQRSLRMGAPEAEVVRLLGDPAAVYDVARAGLRILHYRRRFIPDLLVGVRDGRVAWSHAESGVRQLEEWAALGDAPPAPGSPIQSLNDRLTP